MRLLFALVAVAAWMTCNGCSGKEPGQRSRPDVIVVTVDTLRPDHLGTYGYARARTPQIDGLAAAGVRFSQATTSLPRTTPALASLFTGLEPRHHGATEVGMKLEHGKTLASYLLDVGYATVGISGSPVAGPDQNLDRGFEHFKVIPLATAQALTEAALHEVAKTSAAKPLLLWVHYVDPHFEYRPPESFQPQPAAPRCRKLMEQLDSGQIQRGEAFSNRENWAADALDDCVALYDAEIAYSDSSIGQLLAGLGSHGRLQHAHVFFASDHGEHLGEAGLYYEHGPTVHDADLRIPLIWSGPGIPRGRVDDEPAQLEDVTPTLLSLLGLQVTPQPSFDGRTLAMRLLGDAPKVAEDSRYAFAESGSALQVPLFQFISSGRASEHHCVNGPRYSLCERSGEAPKLYDHVADPRLTHDVGASLPDELRDLEAARRRWPAEQARERAVRGTRFKLVQYPKFEGGYRQALYDLKADPSETTDVSERFPELVAALERALEGWLKGVPALRAPASDARTQEALRALGYAE